MESYNEKIGTVASSDIDMLEDPGSIINYTFTVEPESAVIGRNMIQTLLDHRKRWKSLSLHFYSTAPIPSTFKNDFQILESFRLVLHQPPNSFRAIVHGRDIMSSLLRVTCCSPTLKQIQIPRFPSDLLISMPSVAFSALTHRCYLWDSFL